MVLQWTSEHDGTGKVLGTARVSSFAGAGSAWLEDGDLIDFADACRVYPLAENGPRPQLVGGVVGNGDSGPTLSVRLVPSGPLGQVGVSIRLASTNYVGHQWRTNAVDISLLTTYQQVRRFANEFSRAVTGQGGEARLVEAALS